MQDHLNDALTEAVRRFAKPTSPDELKQRGVSRVRSVSLKGVGALIEKAINRAMMDRTIGGLEDGEGLSAAARREFLSLVKAGPTQEVTESEVERLKRELHERRRAFRMGELARRRREQDEDLAAENGMTEELRRLFASWGGSPDRPSALEHEVIGLVTNRMREARRRGYEERLVQYREQNDRLERRIAKLSRALDSRDEELRRLSLRRQVDGGLASVYDEVQGLDSQDALFEKKRELMGAIFEANLEIRGLLLQQRANPA